MDGGAWWAAVHGVAMPDTTERLHFHLSLSCIGEGNGDPLQCSCLENPRDGGAWWAAVYGVAQSQTQLKWLSNSKGQSEPLIWGIWPWNPVLDQRRGRYAWYTCERRKAATGGEKWVRPTEGSRDPALSSRTDMSSSTQPPDPSLGAPLPSLLLDSVRQILLFAWASLNRQSKWSLMKTNVKWLLFLTSFLCACVCWVRDCSTSLQRPPYSPDGDDEMFSCNQMLSYAQTMLSHRLWVLRSQRSFALSQTPLQKWHHYKRDPTGEDRELFQYSDKPWWKRIWKRIHTYV